MKKPERKTVYDCLQLIHKCITAMDGLNPDHERLRIGMMICLVDLIELMGFDKDCMKLETRICKGGRLPAEALPAEALRGKICKTGPLVV